MRDAFSRRALGVLSVFLIVVELYRLTQRSGYAIDAAVSLVGVWLLWRYGDALRQDRMSVTAICGWLVLHNLGLYEYVDFLLRWDKWMHLVGGVAIALFFSRMYAKERGWALAFTVVFLTLGVGALHEIVEWLGFRVAGTGQGFLLYGAGDFGEWQDSITDMICNLAGALVVALGTKR